MPDSEIEETRVLSCPNCAAQVEFDPEHPCRRMPVLRDTRSNGYRRQPAYQTASGVLPFALDERTAHKAMGDWLGRLWFAPNGLKEYARKGRKMQGIYVPYWTFDADTTSNYRGERGVVYYETRTVMRDGKRVQQQVPKVRWSPKSGRVARFFDDVLVLASQSLPKSVYRRIGALGPAGVGTLSASNIWPASGPRPTPWNCRTGYTEARRVHGAGDRTRRAL